MSGCCPKCLQEIEQLDAEIERLKQERDAYRDANAEWFKRLSDAATEMGIPEIADRNVAERMAIHWKAAKIESAAERARADRAEAQVAALREELEKMRLAPAQETPE